MPLEDLLLLGKAIAAMDEHDAALVIAYYSYGVADSRLAEILGVGRWEIHTRIRRCMASARKALGIKVKGGRH